MKRTTKKPTRAKCNTRAPRVPSLAIRHAAIVTRITGEPILSLASLLCLVSARADIIAAQLIAARRN
jgi:hypothetical protein